MALKDNKKIATRVRLSQRTIGWLETRERYKSAWLRAPAGHRSRAFRSTSRAFPPLIITEYFRQPTDRQPSCYLYSQNGRRRSTCSSFFCYLKEPVRSLHLKGGMCSLMIYFARSLLYTASTTARLTMEPLLYLNMAK